MNIVTLMELKLTRKIHDKALTIENLLIPGLLILKLLMIVAIICYYVG